MKVLIIEDERIQSEHVREAVRQCGYDCDIATDGQTGLARLLNGDYDIAVIDVEIPKLDGLAIIRRAKREKVGTYLMILSSHGSPSDRVSGLLMGADDYLVKPIPIDELELRLRAIARRIHAANEPEILTGRDIVVDTVAQTVRRNGQEIDLSPTEKKILILLMRNKGRCVPYGAIADSVWGPEVSPFASVVTANVCRLRKKLYSADEPCAIHTVRDFGYVFK